MSSPTVPPAWVINLDERPDRLAAFRSRAAAAQLQVSELTVTRPTLARQGWGGSPESCGNAAAHQQLLAAGQGPLLVFEDDAMPPPLTGAHIRAALAAMPAQWELCLLGSGGAIPDTHRRAYGPVTPVLRFWLTHAYLVSPAGRAAMGECAARANWHWDHLASRRMCGRRQAYAFLPSLVGQDPALGSDNP